MAAEAGTATLPQADSGLSTDASPRTAGTATVQPGGTASNAVGERPYRSHLRPACQACRRRKSRCKVDDGEEKGCLMCRVHGTKCEFPTASNTNTNASSSTRAAARNKRTEQGVPGSYVRPARSGGTSQKQIRSLPPPPPPPTSLPAPLSRTTPPPRYLARLSDDDDDDDDDDGAAQHSTTMIAGLGSPEEEESSHIVGPVVTSDTQILADYLRADHHGAGRRLDRVVRPSRGGSGPVGAGNSVMFARVRRRPMGQTPNQTVASGKCHIIERIIEPFADELIDTYFRKANACFPLLDEGSFRDQFRRQPSHISSALLASVYAHALTFWSQPRRAAGRHCPDSRFVWNQATDALYSELQLCPGMSTVVAVLLDVGGRPSTSMIGNGVLIGSAVSIAHGLGLHRDPTEWEISESEKRIRVQIWWALVVHDRWFSLAYGTPPHIQTKFSDVARPKADGGGSATFLALVSLSEVLDAFLVHIYTLMSERPSSPEFDPGAALNRWEESLTGDIRRLILQGKDLSIIPGASNIRLAYLFVRLLQRRIELDNARDTGQRMDSPALSDCYVRVRRAAEEIVRLVQALRTPQLNDFWLPTAAFIFTSTIAFLLRVALETEKTASGLVESISLSLADDLLVALRGHQQKSAWDLGDVCLAQYADVVEELRKATPAVNAGQGGPEASLPLIDWQDYDLPGLPDVEDLFPNLWDMFDSNF